MGGEGGGGLKEKPLYTVYSLRWGDFIQLKVLLVPYLSFFITLIKSMYLI